MIEKEFRELLTNLELTQIDKKDLISFLNQIKSSIDNINGKDYKVYVNEPVLDNNCFIKNNKIINYYVLLEFKNKNLPLSLALEITKNIVFNNVYLGVKGNLNSYSFNNNTLIMNYGNYEIHFVFLFKKENIIKDELYNDSLSIMYENYLAHKEFLKIMNKDYNRFNSILMLINNYRIELKISSNYNDYLMDAMLLAYGMENYDYENNIIDYLKNYCHAINDLLEGKTIILPDELYNDLKVRGSLLATGNYKIIDITNKQNNLVNYNNEFLKELKAIKTLLNSKFPKDGSVVSIDCTPAFVLKDKTIEWTFKIIGTDIFNHGGEYDYDLDNYYSSIYKGMLKGLQFIVKNKLGNNILVIINNNSSFSLNDCFPNQLVKEDMNKLSYENQSRYANVLQFAKDFDLGLEFKIN